MIDAVLRVLLIFGVDKSPYRARITKIVKVVIKHLEVDHM